MISARLSRPIASAARRAYATTAASSEYQVAEASNGIRVAAKDEGNPTVALSVALKAGPRYETAPGLAHVLKNYAFKSTNKRSALRIIRETELLGGILSTTLSREHLFLNAEFRRGDEPFFVELLGEVLRDSKFVPHEYNEQVVPQVAAEYQHAIESNFNVALDEAHKLAFRNSLGKSLLADPHVQVKYEDAVDYAKRAYSDSANTVILGSGIESQALKSLVGDLFTTLPPPPSSSTYLPSQTASYHGGEQRLAGHGSHVSYLVAFPGGSSADKPVYNVLRTLLGGEAATKWNKSSSALAKIESGNVQAINFSYADAGLFGIYAESTTEKIGDAVRSAVQGLQQIAKGSFESQDISRAIAQAKFEAALAKENRIAGLESTGAQVLTKGSVTTLDSTLASLDGITGSQVQEAAAAALKAKPTVVAIGDNYKLPFSDELGL